MTQSPLLVDNFGRRISYLRLSVTDRCDFRCVYCMAEDMEFLPRQQVLSLEELASIAQAFSELGVERIRITGGEPLIRKNVLSLFKQLGNLGLKDLSLTTNGSHLAQHASALKAAGVHRINVSLDSLKQERFKDLTRTGRLSQVLEGLQVAKQQGFERIKINAVILANHNADEVEALTDFALSHQFDISFIEEMPLGEVQHHSRAEEFISSAQLRTRLQQRFKLSPSSTKTGGPSQYWQVKGHSSRIGFISPHSHNFCGDCNRVRVTTEGRLLLCLGNEHSVELKPILRSDLSPQQKLEQLKNKIMYAMSIKPDRHYFDLNQEPQIVRFMNTTGG